MRKANLVRMAILGALAVTAGQLQAASCESLATLALENTTITSAAIVAAGAFQPANGPATAYQNLPAFCRVTASIAPSSDSDIGIEVWLPLEGWIGKFQGVGNGAWLGSISTPALASAVARGYAAASTDTGHTGGSASFAFGHPEKLTDYGYRAVHEMTVQGKALTTAFYDGNAPQRSYFVGCSAGGKQAMKEVQLYPADYDGVVAGSPGLNWSGRALQTVWVGQAVAEAPLPAAKFPLVHSAALAACDALDGAKDGLIENPRRCNFDPVLLQCAAAGAATCLAAGEVATVRAIYNDVQMNPSNRKVVAGLSPGSELGWNTMAGERPFQPGVDLFRYIVYGNAEWDFRSFDWQAAAVEATRNASAMMDALDTNLAPFFARGGRIVSYHGWGDPQISPGSTVDYYESVLAADASARDNYRLFMVPGMAHCGGGEGTDQFDMLTTLEQWVENGEVPESVPAARVVEGKTVRTRPLCAWPETAAYDGTGSVDDAANFACSNPAARE